MMWGEIAVLSFLAAAILAGAGLTIWRKFFAPIREWDESASFQFGCRVADVHEEPFYTWWHASNRGMGGHECLEMDDRIQRKIDVVCEEVASWTYKADAPGIDFEPITEEQTSGDCEDFARVLAYRLMAVGVPAGAMTLGLGSHPRLGWHCILLLNTNEGGYMAEVGNPWFRPWYQHGFITEPGGPPTPLMAPKADGYFYAVSAA